MKIPKWLKWLLGIIGVIMLSLFIIVQVLSESMPQGSKGAQADALANKMFTAINKTAWDETAIVQWTFKGMHDFLWDKKRNLVKVSWDDYEVLVVLDETTGKAWKSGVELTGNEADKLVKTAWGYFCNDSFWLNAPAKAFDPGTERSIVKHEGKDALMVSYISGGVTPGDSYLWILDEQGLPKSYKMWVSIIPVGGMEFTWEKWTNLPTGARIATFHKSKVLDIDISNLKSGTNFSDFGISKDPFMPIL
jgi:hypothetical protein